IKHADGDAIDIEVYEGTRDPQVESVRLVIEVCDGGPGISEATQAQIIERANNVTLKSEWTDTGFSLPACLHMARAAGAEVRIESEPHEGCVVSFLFNATPSAKIALHHPAPDSVASLHILVVDDYPPARQTLQQRLESWGHRVSLATQGEEALAMWKAQPARYAAIITDCTMPVMDGYELTRQIREHERREGRETIPIFGLTAMSGTEAAASCIDAGMDEYLEKPLTPQKLQEMLERYFASAGKTDATVDDKTRQLQLEMIAVNHDDAEHLKQRLEQRERDKVGRMAHRINGGARLMNFTSLKEACEALELACNNEQGWESIEPLVSRVLEEMERFNAWLERQT
ncbi:TPA: response regulator, partial [Enterobacter ludwigii]|nr:response regulator [Enterobacter ludwigii]